MDGLTDEKVPADIGVILGNTINPDGTLSERLEKRCDKGIELFKDSLVRILIVSGGLGKEGYYEGTKMSEYLIAHGVPKEKIIIDNNGNTTEQTAMNVKNMNLPIQSVTVISQYYHLTRTKLAFKNNGFKTVYGAHAKCFEWRDLYSLVREFFGYYKYLFL
jgi:vancomycin permeability regulator SanA